MSSGEIERVNPAAKQHFWAATGISDYLPKDPFVGQNSFFRIFKNFIHLVDNEKEKFATDEHRLNTDVELSPLY